MVSQTEAALIECEDILVRLEGFQNLLNVYFLVLDSQLPDSQQVAEMMIELYQAQTHDSIDRLIHLVKKTRKELREGVNLL